MSDTNFDAEKDNLSKFQANKSEKISAMSNSQQGVAPMMAPPSFSPPIPAWKNGAVGIGRCMNRNAFLWLNNGEQFWFFPVAIGRENMFGYRWRGFGWIYHRINLNNIRTYQCF